MREVAIKVLKTLIGHGYEAYIVGGFVRDFLLGEESLDIDITTNATPEQVTELFDRVIPTGIKHGTVTVVVDNTLIEITTYRSDGLYLDNRRPESIRYSKNIQEDLKRRDFTINSFLLNANMRVIDYLGARADLEAQVIRTIGKPSMRFKEDALRMLRAIRFVSKLGFEIEEETLKAIYEHKDLLRNISIERVKAELSKIFEGKYYFMAKGLLEDICFPRLEYKYPKKSLPEVEMYSCINIDNCFNTTDWKFSNQEKAFIHNVELLLESDYNPYLLYKIPNIEDYYNIIGYYEGKDVVSNIEYIVESLPIRSKNDIIINGYDLIDLGFDGAMIGVILNNVERLIVEGKLQNDKQDVIDYIRRNYDENKRVN